MMHEDAGSRSVSRRGFLVGTGAALAASTLSRPLGAFVHAGGSATLRLGLIGCGGRGSGAAVNALTVAPEAKLVAMCDMFRDQVDASHEHLKNEAVGDRVDVAEDMKFSGFDGYLDLIRNVDVVLLAETPYYRPVHLAAAVAAGKHIFAEKPIAVDAPGVRSVMESCKLAAEKGLSVVSGLCYRYDPGRRELVQRVKDGAIGEIRALQCTYNTGPLWYKQRRLGWTDMEYQNRNWLYYNWLSGDHINEQSIHSIDKILWVMNDEPPVAVTASGGRSVRTEPHWGNIFDHFNCVFEWQNGVRLFHSCRQWRNSDSDVSDYAFGSRGTAEIQHNRITGADAWTFKGKAGNMYEHEMRALFDSIRSGTPINNGDYMCKSTMAAIMGRMSAYTGKRLSWEQALSSQQRLGPKELKLGEAPQDPVARPGETAFL